jgi:hypothetical protein
MAGLVGLVVAVAIVVAAFLLMRPKQTLPIDELLARLTHISGDANLTAVQKRHLAELAWKSYAGKVVSVIGVIEDVFPNGSITMKTSARELPRVGVELARASAEELRGIMKGKSITLRAKLPGWKEHADVADLLPGFHGAKAFCAGQWYPVKATYKVRPDVGAASAATVAAKAAPTTKTFY